MCCVTQGFFILFSSGIVVWAGVEAGTLCFGDAATLDWLPDVPQRVWIDYQMYLGAAATPEFLLFHVSASLSFYSSVSRRCGDAWH